MRQATLSKCILCGSSEKQLISRMNRYGVQANNVICKKCGLVYIDKDQNIQGLKKYYGAAYRKQFTVVDINSQGYRNTQREIAMSLSRLVPKRIKRVLEIGCANGVLLEELKKVIPGIQAFGIEPDRELASQASEKFGTHVFCGMLEEYPFPGKGFDLIIMEHVLEHFKDPLACLAIVRKLLSPNGLVYVEVPSIRSPYGDLERNFLQHVHLFNFSPKTIGILFKLAGFEVSKSLTNGAFMAFLIKKGAYCKRSDIDFSCEGEDPRLLYKYLQMYKHWFRVNESKSVGQVNVKPNKTQSDDTELEAKITRLSTASMKSRILALMEQDDHEQTLKQIIAYFDSLDVSIADILDLALAGSILSKNLSSAHGAEIFEGILHAAANVAGQHRKVGSGNIV